MIRSGEDLEKTLVSLSPVDLERAAQVFQGRLAYSPWRNARELKWMVASGLRNDRVDSQKLARLARAGRVLPVPAEHRTTERKNRAEG
jgi:hypothetical protein